MANTMGPIFNLNTLDLLRQLISAGVHAAHPDWQVAVDQSSTSQTIDITLSAMVPGTQLMAHAAHQITQHNLVTILAMGKEKIEPAFLHLVTSVVENLIHTVQDTIQKHSPAPSSAGNAVAIGAAGAEWGVTTTNPPGSWWGNQGSIKPTALEAAPYDWAKGVSASAAIQGQVPVPFPETPAKPSAKPKLHPAPQSMEDIYALMGLPAAVSGDTPPDALK